MSAVESMFYAAVLAWVRENVDEDAVKVTDVDQESRRSGGCETCEYTYDVIEITFDTQGRRGRLYEYSGGFGEFIRAL